MVKSSTKNNITMTAIAVVIALILPFIMAKSIYRTIFSGLFSEFDLHPSTRILATLWLGVVDYFFALLILKLGNVSWYYKTWPHLLCFILTIFWCIFVGLLWLGLIRDGMSGFGEWFLWLIS